MSAVIWRRQVPGRARPRAARTAAGYRAYSAGDVERLREMLAHRRLGFGLREVADLVGDPLHRGP